ncbi:uncharacterized protein N7515_005189 [Penicillium bovifimosum]|uniref:DUF5872 domain-containing protein n=1 Tax=Penicillium bovifimosum TaxID=126998 RepID=A0A9W9GS86_9EURO|nr:uncharacterized protein N7515_005189 [Penicillium bovifimosum]KAJ5129150.1 hypothetical protein N7515_005189 [Penicillium bovifimosum]
MQFATIRYTVAQNKPFSRPIHYVSIPLLSAMPPKDNYTDPELRSEIKEEIHNSDKGGKPGQWSARKAQMMASEYKKRGGGYKTSKEEGQTESQKHLENWTKEEWQTKEGSGTARQEDDSRKRYLPKKAWEELGEGEKEETDKKKLDESKEGKQFVGNTESAKQARRRASSEVKDGGEESRDRDAEKDEEGDKNKEGEDEAGDMEEDNNKVNEKENGVGKDTRKDDKEDKENEKNKYNAQEEEEEEQQQEDLGKEKEERENEHEKNPGTTKRAAGAKRNAKQDKGPNKKQKDSERMKSLRKRD